jgi:hypothetical protein
MSTLLEPLTDVSLQAKKKDCQDWTNIWVDPPEGYKCLTGNQVRFLCLVCCEVTTRSIKVGYLMYLGNSNGVLPVLILSCCEDETMLLV